MELIGMVIAWICVGMFLATGVITLLGLLGVVKLPPDITRMLIKGVLLEVVALCIMIVTDVLETPGTARDRVRSANLQRFRVFVNESGAEKAFQQQLARLLRKYRQSTRLPEQGGTGG